MTTRGLISRAITALGDRTGSSVAAIEKYLIANHEVGEGLTHARLRTALKCVAAAARDWCEPPPQDARARAARRKGLKTGEYKPNRFHPNSYHIGTPAKRSRTTASPAKSVSSPKKAKASKGKATCKKATLQVVTKVLWPFRAKKSDVKKPRTKKAAAATIEEAAPAAPEEEGITAAPSSTAPVVQAV